MNEKTTDYFRPFGLMSMGEGTFEELCSTSYDPRLRCVWFAV